MRPTLRALAVIRPASKYIEMGLPTGLAGLHAVHSPRSSLLYLYTATLEKLKAMPETSLYRQSVENVTRHRLSIVESVKPEGWEAWSDRAADKLADGAERVGEDGVFIVDGARGKIYEKGGKAFFVRENKPPVRETNLEWDGEEFDGEELEGSRSAEERADQAVMLSQRRDPADHDIQGWEPEPQLTAEQVADIEDRIGSGLIEELIAVAEGELKLTDVMMQSKAWEDLAEKPAEDQWKYFDRKE